MNKILLLLLLFFNVSLQGSELFLTLEKDITLPVFSPHLWDHFSVEKISDPKLKELMQSIYKYRENAKKYILAAEDLRMNITDKALRDAIAGAIGSAVVAARGGLTTVIIAAAIGALSGLTVGMYYQYMDIKDLLELAEAESKKADMLEQYVIANACILN